MTPLLHLKASSNWASILELLLHAGADVDHVSDEGDNILLKYARFPATKIVQALLHAGAKPNLADQRGYTAMHHAARFALAEMMQSLMAAGADIDSRNPFGRTPLLETCYDRHDRARAPTIRLLLENGARVDVVDGTGMSALTHMKVLVLCGATPHDWQDTVRSIEVLLEHDAVVNAIDWEVFYRMGTPGPRKVASRSSNMEQISTSETMM
ncbi:hypothetical protein LTR17_005097 [Elasticomyces elasticus]|nr:hypothetical protein LTR17_005097 [Elasticomyces elasticus]